MKNKIKKRVSDLQTQLGVLLSKEPETIICAVERYRKLFKCNRVKSDGIYMVSKPNDKDTMIYIGRTITAKQGLKQRLSNHLQKQALGRYRAKKKDVAKYLVRVCEESDCTARRDFETFAIGVLSPKFNIG